MKAKNLINQLKENKEGFIRFFGLAMLVFCCMQVKARDVDSLVWQKANSYYETKKYDSAAIHYEQLAHKNLSSYSLYYNLGNTYFRLQQYPKSILNYEKSLKLYSNNQKALVNINLAKANLQNPVTEIQPVFFMAWWFKFVSFFNSSVWGFLALILFLGLLVFFFFHFSRKFKISYFDRWSAAFIGLFLFSFFLFYESIQASKIEKAVVMNTEVPVYLDLNSSKTDIYAPAGTVLIITKRKENYVFVELPNGAKGWVDQQSIQEVKI